MSFVAVAIGGSALIGAGASMYSARQQNKALKSAQNNIDYGAAYLQSVDGQLAALPDILDAEKEYGPQFQELEAEAAGRGAHNMARLLHEIEQEYGPQYLDQYLENLERVDPESVAARGQLSRMVMEDAERGGRLSDDERREVQQSVRGGQAARGNILGDAASFEEAMETGQAAFRRRQAAMGNLDSFLRTPTPQQGMAQLQQTPFMPQTGPTAIDRGAAGGGASSIYQGQQAMAQTRLNMPNPWMQGLGMTMGAGSQIYGGYLASQGGQSGGGGGGGAMPHGL